MRALIQHRTGNEPKAQGYTYGIAPTLDNRLNGGRENKQAHARDKEQNDSFKHRP